MMELHIESCQTIYLLDYSDLLI